jgi:hypothetical protein
VRQRVPKQSFDTRNGSVGLWLKIGRLERTDFATFLIRDAAWEPMPISRKESGDRFKKLAWPYLKGASQCNDIQYGNVPFPALDTAHIVSMKFRKFGQLFLGETPSEPK